MSMQRCQRCGCEEHIPTHQFVKFDLKQSFLCKRCWEDFRKWYNVGGKLDQTGYDSAA